jgi:hypothetical protein
MTKKRDDFEDPFEEWRRRNSTPEAQERLAEQYASRPFAIFESADCVKPSDIDFNAPPPDAPHRRKWLKTEIARAIAEHEQTQGSNADVV